MTSQCKDIHAPDIISCLLQSKFLSSVSLERAGESLGLWSWEEPRFELDSNTAQLCGLGQVNVSAQHKM